MKIMIDAGHRNNQNDYGASGNGFKESSLALSISKKLKAELNKHQVIVYMSRETEENIISLEQRTSKANNLNVDLYVSIHCNAYNGQAHGVEVLYYADDTLSKDMCNRMCNLTGARNRGAKSRKDLHVLKATKMDAVLVECGFIDHSQEGKLLADSSYQDKLVKGIAEAIIHKYKIVVQEQKGTPILSQATATATLEQCKVWAKSKQAKHTFINNLPIYFKKCAKVGINPVVAIVQYAKETGYGKFGGVLTEDFKNPCGLKIPAGGDCKDPEVHKRFATWEDGIKAHIDHLALYAGAEGYPKSDTLDPRHFSYLKGKCKTVEALSGNWSPSSTYGDDLVKMLKEVECIKVQDEYQEALKVLNQEGVVNTLQVWEDKEKININHVPQLIIKCANKIIELKNI